MQDDDVGREYQLIEWLTERVGYAPGGVNIGVVRTGDDGAILIDSGLNDSAVRKVLRVLDQEGRQVRAIVTTHGHADHFGGNAFVVKRSGARVYAPAWDEATLRYPLLQPVNLFAGADPPASMRTGFLLAAVSPVDEIFTAGALAIDDVQVEAISLAGHSPNQMGLLIDGVFFCADVVLPERVIARYRMPYLFSVREHVRAMSRATEVPHTVAVPGHGPVVEHVRALVDENRALVLHVAELVLEFTREPVTAEVLLSRVLRALGAEPADAPTYYLLHPTIFAFLTYLEEQGKVRNVITQQQSIWVRT